MTSTGKDRSCVRMSFRADRDRSRTSEADSPPGARVLGSAKESRMTCCQFSMGSAESVRSLSR